MHRLAVIRSLSHANANHVQASLLAMTGHAHPPEAESRGDFPPSQNDFLRSVPYCKLLASTNSYRRGCKSVR